MTRLPARPTTSYYKPVTIQPPGNTPPRPPSPVVPPGLPKDFVDTRLRHRREPLRPVLGVSLIPWHPADSAMRVEYII